MLEHILHILEDWSLGIVHTQVFILTFTIPLALLVIASVWSLRKSKK